MAEVPAFLTKLLALLRSEVGDETFASLIPIARAHAGGVAKAEKAREREEAEEGDSMTHSEPETRSPFLTIFADPIALAEEAKTINVQIFPHVGTYRHPEYGDLQITPEFLQKIKDNFDSRVYNQSLPLTIDLEHQSKVSGAAGWIKDLEFRGDQGLWATIEVNDRGAQLVREDAFRYFSPEYYDAWQDPATSVEYENVLIGGALTARPFFKGMQPIYMANERTYCFSELAPDAQSVEPPPAEQSESEPAPEVNDSEHEEPEEKGMTVDPKEFTELSEKVATLSAALAEEKQLREAAQDAAKSAREEIAKVKRDNQRRELSELVRNNRFAFKGEVPEVVDRLERLQTALSEDDWSAYVENQKALHAQLAESELLKQKGSEGVPAASPLDTLVAAKVAAGKSKPEALAEALKENPKLYAEHVRTINRRAVNPE